MISWIAIDWGTTNLRLWGMDAQDNIVEARQSNQGMASLKAEDFETVLLSHIQNWLGNEVMPIIACGMVGAKQGWCEAPYSTVPTCPATDYIDVPTQDARITVRIISGLNQNAPADVLRGEETQVAGFLTDEPDFVGTLCLPGTHSKWISLNQGQIPRFQTVMTGEIFALLTEHSILRHSLGSWSDMHFLSAVSQGLKAPENLLSKLFSVRAEHLLKNTEGHGIAYISGTLIGAELASTRDLWHENEVVIIGSNTLARLYQLAFNEIGINTRNACGEKLCLRGLTRAFRA